MEFGADLSYYQPLNYGLVLNHHLKASVGAYKQAELSREKMWSISYGHQWRVGKICVSHEIGRKRLFTTAVLTQQFRKFKLLYLLLNT